MTRRSVCTALWVVVTLWMFTCSCGDTQASLGGYTDGGNTLLQSSWAVSSQRVRSLGKTDVLDGADGADTDIGSGQAPVTPSNSYNTTHPNGPFKLTRSKNADLFVLELDVYQNHDTAQASNQLSVVVDTSFAGVLLFGNLDCNTLHCYEGEAKCAHVVLNSYIPFDCSVVRNVTMGVGSLHAQTREIQIYKEDLLRQVFSSVNDTDGIFGLAYSPAFYQSPLIDLLGDMPQLIGLDLRPSNDGSGTSFIHFGGWYDKQEHVLVQYDDFIWSESQPAHHFHYHQFPMYHLSLCGVDLLRNYSSHWLTVVHTTEECLVLPEEFYNMVLSWLPTTCESKDGMTSCDIHESPAFRWPALSFRLTEHGEVLYIPLDSLLTFKDGHQVLCLRKGKSIVNDPRQYVVFGYRVLYSMFIMFDLRNNWRRVGLANKSQNIVIQGRYPDDTSCARRRKCHGLQSLYEPMNVCLDPPCHDYYFQQVNPETKYCELTFGFKFMSWTLVILVAAAEIIINQVYLRMTWLVARGEPLYNSGINSSNGT
eukprot:GFYU01007473.1.p1 GENE.GFYU01007473.1~~GFYU01007473.1.p1  ORF type:complete len:535 (-),score=115.37 GFYU01007473.1:126-1730(-)